MRDADGLLLTADILSSDTSNGEVRCKIGEATTGQGKSPDVPMYCSHGFVGVPESPDSDGSACQAFYAQDGNEQKILGTRDNRLSSQVGQLSPGDRAIISRGDARVLVKRNGTIALIAKSPGGGTMMSSVDGAAGKIQHVVDDVVFTMQKGSVVLMVSGGGGLRIDKNGVQVFGGSFQAVTAAVQLGDMGTPPGTPPPPSPATAVAVGPQPGAVSTKVFVAP